MLFQEYMQVSQSYDVPHDCLSQWEKASSPVSINSKFDSTSSLFGVEEHRHCIQSLAQHVMYSECPVPSSQLFWVFVKVET